MKQVTVLLGGFMGFDGYVTSAGMYGLVAMLNKLPDVHVNVLQWGNYRQANTLISLGDKRVIIGYSGGGSRATWLNHDYPATIIDLMILYDPSPSWQMFNINSNVKKAISYHNTTPFFFGLGGGVLVGPNVTTVDIAMNHMFVQSDLTLHAKTCAEVAKL